LNPCIKVTILICGSSWKGRQRFCFDSALTYPVRADKNAHFFGRR